MQQMLDEGKKKGKQEEAEGQIEDPVQCWKSLETYVWGGVGCPCVPLVEQLNLFSGRKNASLVNLFKKKKTFTDPFEGQKTKPAMNKFMNTRTWGALSVQQTQRTKTEEKKYQHHLMQRIYFKSSLLKGFLSDLYL